MIYRKLIKSMATWEDGGMWMWRSCLRLSAAGDVNVAVGV